jgi:ribosomal protein S21
MQKQCQAESANTRRKMLYEPPTEREKQEKLRAD